jgi:hypothetical protein
MKQGQKFGDSDEDTSPSNGFDDIVNEICKEAGMKATRQTRGLGEPARPLKTWRPDQASLLVLWQASAHRTSHNGLENDAMCCTSQVGGGHGGPIPGPQHTVQIQAKISLSGFPSPSLVLMILAWHRRRPGVTVTVIGHGFRVHRDRPRAGHCQGSRRRWHPGQRIMIMPV